ncbi:unnamed protein product [Rodentolepis nana]|uniref:G protein-coupled receptor n=1 Tax=Rodentolepis nana TaxID=102285 RepID=A0A0R3T8N9_RODNA|nr:unnamed protein product [Rodentolepis nana]
MNPRSLIPRGRNQYSVPLSNMGCHKFDTQDHFDLFIRKVFINQGSLTFLDAFSLCLSTTDKAIFTSICVIVAATGIISSLCIITANVLYRIRFQRESDFFTSGERRRRTTKRFSINPFKVEITQENRFSYFDALSSQAKFRYSHVVFAIAVFNLLASLFLIPLSVITICGWSPSVMAENYFIIICATWSVLQILFMSAFFFVNTTIQFFSIVSPLTFTLRRSPLWATFLFVVGICVVQSFLMVSMIFNQLTFLVSSLQSGVSNEIIFKTITGYRVILTFPIVVYALTWICTIIMYAFIIRHMHAAIENVYKITEITPRSMPYQQSLWQKVTKKNIQKCMILGAGTTVFYVLELPLVITVYRAIPPCKWTVLAHLTVHAVTPLMHITLSKSFRTMLYGITSSRRRVFTRISSIS